MDHKLTGLKVLVLVSNGVDESTMSCVQRDLLRTGASVKTVGTENGLVNSWNASAGPMGTWGLYFPVDQHISQTLGADFDVLVVPGGSRGIQKLGDNPHAERIVSGFIDAGKPMAFIGDAVALLARTGLAKGVQLCGPDAVQKTMTDAGAQWNDGADETVWNNIMTGKAADVAAFVQNMIVHFTNVPELKAAA